MRIAERTDSAEALASRQTPLQLNVVYTDLAATREALHEAARLATPLDARVRVIVLRPVPYPLTLDNPPVSERLERERVLTIVNESAPDANVLMCYCRDQADALLYLLEFNLDWLRPSSIVVIAGKKRRWFPTKAQRIARRLEEAGHKVIFVGL